ncbi:MAG: hypothetical protein ACI8W8_000946 [Rhodothermales bacterium]|jgi:uncharacterized protein (AIM24 family)
MQLLLAILRVALSKCAAIIAVVVITVLLTLGITHIRRIEARHQEYQAKAELLAMRETELAKLDGELSTEQAQVAGLSAEHDVARNALTQISDALAKRSAELKAATATLTDTESAKERLDRLFSSRTRLSGSLRHELKRRTGALAQWEGNPPTWLHPIERISWNAELKARRATLDMAKRQFTESERKLRAVSGDLKAKVAEFANLSQLVGQKREALTDPEEQARLDSLQTQADTLGVQRHTLQELLADKRELRSRRRAAVAALEADVRESYAGVRVYAKVKDECLLAFRTSQGLIAGLVLAVLLGPILWAGLWYYLLAPLARLSPALQFLPPGSDGELRAGESAKAHDHQLIGEIPVLARMEWVQRYPAKSRKRTRFLWRWNAPFTSFAAGLSEMTEITNVSEEPEASIELCSGTDPDMQVVPIELYRHSGIVLRPTHVIAISGDIELHARWRLLNLHAWVSGTLRHLMFSGTGMIYVRGCGGLVARETDSLPVRMEEARIIGYDGRVGVTTARTETFWPYYRGKTSLYDLEFNGDGLVIYQQALAPAHRQTSNPVSRALDAALRTVGKVLGV